MADRPAPASAHSAAQNQPRNPAIPVLVAALLAIGLIVATVALLMHFNGGASHARAVWDKPSAPVVYPVPINLQ